MLPPPGWGGGCWGLRGWRWRQWRTPSTTRRCACPPSAAAAPAPRRASTRGARSPRAADGPRVFRSLLALKIGLLIMVVLIVGFGLSTILTIQPEAALLVE